MSQGSPLPYEGEGCTWVILELFPMEALHEQEDPTDEHQANYTMAAISGTVGRSEMTQ